MNDAETIEKPQKITTRKVRHSKIVKDALEGKSYTEIAQENNLNPKYPRQDVYRIIHSPTGQAELAEIARKVSVDVDSCLTKLESAYGFAKDRKNALGMTQAVMAQAKIAGLLVDKVDQTQRIVERSQDMAQLSTDDLAQELVNRLRMSAQGISTSDTKAEVDRMPIISRDTMASKPKPEADLAQVKAKAGDGVGVPGQDDPTGGS